MAARKLQQSQLRLLSFIALIFLSANGSIMVLLSQQMSAKSFAPKVAETVPASASLYSYGNEFDGLSFYLKREIRSLQRGVSPEAGSFVVLYERNIAELRSSRSDGAQLIELGQSPNGVERLGRPVLLLEVRK